MSATTHDMRDSIGSKLFKLNSLLECPSQPEIAINSLKTLFWGTKVVQGRRCWYSLI